MGYFTAVAHLFSLIYEGFRTPFLWKKFSSLTVLTKPDQPDLRKYGECRGDYSLILLFSDGFRGSASTKIYRTCLPRMCKSEITSILIKCVGKKTATKLAAGISGWLSISDSKLEFWYPFLVGIPIFG